MKLLLLVLSLLLMGFFFHQKDDITPTKRSEIASTFLDGQLYVAGGINFWGSSNRFEAYDVPSATWQRLPDLPKSLNHVGLAAFDGNIYLSGGFFNAIQTKWSNVLYIYNTTTAQWTSLSTMPDGRAAHAMIYRDGYLHLIGGTEHEEVWSYNLTTKDWEMDQIAPLPEKRDHISVLQDELHLYVVGGRQRGIVKADCWRYDFEEKKWTIFATLPQPRGGQAACLYQQRIHIIGGEDLQEGVTFDRHDIYDLNSQTWQLGTPLTTARHGFVAELVGDDWYVFGGGKQAGIRTLISTTADLEVLELSEE